MNTKQSVLVLIGVVLVLMEAGQLQKLKGKA